MKCKNCRFAIGKKVWISTREGSPLQKAQVEAQQKGGIVCSGDFRVVVGEDLKKDAHDCAMYKRGITTFG